MSSSSALAACLAPAAALADLASALAGFSTWQTGGGSRTAQHFRNRGMDAAIPGKDGTAAGSSLDEDRACRQVAADAVAHMARGAGAALFRRPPISPDCGHHRARDAELLPGRRGRAPLRWRAPQLGAAGGAIRTGSGPLRQIPFGA